MSSFAAVADSNQAIPSPMEEGPSARTLTASPREKRILRVRAAGFPRRLLSALVDFLLVALVTVGVSTLATVALGVKLPTAKEFGPDFVLAGLLDRNPMVLGAIGLFAGLGALYQIYLAGILGQSIGMRLLHLRIITVRGQSPGPFIAVARCIFLALSLAPAGLGFFWCIFDRERRSLHDHLASTHVIIDAP